MKRLLILTPLADGNSQAREAALQTFVAELGEAQYAAAEDLLFSVKDGQVEIMLADKPLKECADLIHLRNVQSYQDYANAIRLYAEAYGMQLINAVDATYPYHGKVSQGFLFALSGIPTPNFISSSNNQVLYGALEGLPFSMPFVLKHNEGIKGADNYLIDKSEKFHQVLSSEKGGYVAQPFIANQGELRVLTFGGRIEPLVLEKRAQTGEYLNNTSQGATSRLVALSEVKAEIIRDALRAAEITGREIGGVDVLLGDDGKWWILEVNHTPAIVSGVFQDEKLQRYKAFVNIDI